MFNVHGKWASRLVNTVGISRKHEMSRAFICVFTVCVVCIPDIVHPSVGVAEETIGLWKGDTISLHCHRDKMVRCPAKEDGQLCCQF